MPNELHFEDGGRNDGKHLDSPNSTSVSDTPPTTHRCPYAAALSSSSSLFVHNDTRSEDNNEHRTASTTTGFHDSLMEVATRSCPAFQNGSCPFKDMQKQKQQHNKNNDDTSSSSSSTAAAAVIDIEAAVRQTLLQIPASHLREAPPLITTTASDNGNNGQSSSSESSSHPFIKFIQLLHTALDAVDDDHDDDNSKGDKASQTAGSRFRFPAGCPVAKVVHLPSVSSDVKNDAQGQSLSTTPRLNSSAAVKFTEAMEHCSLASIMARMASSLEVDIADTPSNIDVSDSRNNNDDTSTMVQLNEIGKEETKDNDNATKSAVGLENTLSPSGTSSDDCVAEKPGGSNSRILLSECFKTGTIESHQAAEDVHFVKNFIRGIIDADLYKELVVQLFYVYDALEGCLLSSIDSTGAKSTNHRYGLDGFVVFHQKLQRKKSLVEDLDFWFGSKVTADIIGTTDGSSGSSKNDDNSYISVACREYVERVKYIAETEPLLLLAHSYTRYLGDLSGGKILARVAKKALNLSNSTEGKGAIDGLAFYDFSTTIPSAKKFKDEYKCAMDELKLTPDQVVKLVNEANIAFVLNMRLFEELDVKAGVPNATVRSLESALQYSNNHNVTLVVDGASSGKSNSSTADSSIDSNANVKISTAKCPFAVMASTASAATAAASTKHYSKTNFSKLAKQAECPFANLSTAVGGVGSLHSTASQIKNTTKDITKLTCDVPSSTTTKSGRCPWPFVVFHDPVQFLRDWQTWALVACILSYCWYNMKKATIG